MENNKFKISQKLKNQQFNSIRKEDAFRLHKQSSSAHTDKTRRVQNCIQDEVKSIFNNSIITKYNNVKNNQLKDKKKLDERK